MFNNGNEIIMAFLKTKDSIDTGIGHIDYSLREASLDLVQLMEALAAAIQQQGATAVLRQLESTYAV